MMSSSADDPAEPAAPVFELSVKYGSSVCEIAVAQQDMLFRDVKDSLRVRFDIPSEAQKLLLRGKECPDGDNVVAFLEQKKQKRGSRKKVRLMLIKRVTFKKKQSPAAAKTKIFKTKKPKNCLLYTSDAADE